MVKLNTTRIFDPEQLSYLDQNLPLKSILTKYYYLSPQKGRAVSFLANVSSELPAVVALRTRPECPSGVADADGVMIFSTDFTRIK